MIIYHSKDRTTIELIHIVLRNRDGDAVFTKAKKSSKLFFLYNSLWLSYLVGPVTPAYLTPLYGDNYMYGTAEVILKTEPGVKKHLNLQNQFTVLSSLYLKELKKK